MSIRSSLAAQQHLFAPPVQRPADLRPAPEHDLGLPATRDEERAIGTIIEQLVPLRDLGAVGQIVVVDNSSDQTGRIARELGVEVHDQADLAPELGPVLGKGDAMWRALPMLNGEVICFLDADFERFGPHFASSPWPGSWRLVGSCSTACPSSPATGSASPC